jgi:hypothetical protein
MGYKSGAGIDRQAFAVEAWRSESDVRRTSIGTRDWGGCQFECDRDGVGCK